MKPPKPPRPTPNPKRLSERRAVTIIAGFRGQEGIVLCADTQETVANLSKRNVPKLRFEPANRPFFGEEGASENEIAVAFCGAGSSGPFIDKLVDGAWEAARNETSLTDACGAIEESLKDTYREFGKIYQRGYCPEAELIYGVKMDGSSKLFSAVGPLVNEKRDYVTGGAGYYMADFLAARMHGFHLNIRQCVILAAYVLFQAKEHVEGCGGQSHIAILRDDGTSGRVGVAELKAITELLELTDTGTTGKIILELADFAISDKEFEANAHQVVKDLRGLRDAKRTELQDSLKFFRAIFSSLPKHDSIGLPLPDSPKP